MKRAAIILVAEDNPDDVLLLHMAFEKAGFPTRLMEVSDGAEAIRFLKGEGRYADRTKYPLPHLVLLDLQMPTVSGFDVLAWIRQQHEFKSLPVVIVTTSSYGPEIQRAYELGANSFLTKPVDFTEFVDAVRTMADYWLTRCQLPSGAAFWLAPENGASSEIN